MSSNPYAIYTLHAIFWASFILTRLIVRLRGSVAPSEAPTPASAPPTTARFSRLAIAPHLVAFALLYTGIADAVFGHSIPEWFAGQRVAGTLLIIAGAMLADAALIYFRSWRLRAQIDAAHRLATGGPFRYLRNPIYMALNLLALGSAIWISTPLVWLSVALMCIGGDVRARVEEPVLLSSFGDEYRAYASRTRRFIPGVY